MIDHLPIREARVAVESFGEVSALLCLPDDARWMLALAHGAGAGMRHPFMEAVAERLGRRGMATLRYQFPYMDTGIGRGRPDHPTRLQATVRGAVATAAELAPDLPLLAGGKSLGGRMTTAAAAAGELSGLGGIVLFGFPLHPPRRPAVERAAHLGRVGIPMLFLQGTRDDLADLDLITRVCTDLGPLATLHVVEGGDHSFAVLKRSGRTSEEVLDELADTTVAWAERL